MSEDSQAPKEAAAPLAAGAPAAADSPAGEPGADDSLRHPPVGAATVPVSPFRRFAFAVVPAVALLEIGAHLVQISTVVPESDWMAAKAEVQKIVKPDDLVAFAPYWTDPLGREYFKDAIASIAREARDDDTRFRRAIEVSIRGKHLPELEDWSTESTTHAGAVTITVKDNPRFVPPIEDLAADVNPEKMSVAVLAPQGSMDCGFVHDHVQTGGLGFGPAIPAGRFACPGGGFIGASIMQASDYRPHRCLYSPPIGSGRTLKATFHDVAFGQHLQGHAGIDWDSDKALEPPVTLVWKAAGKTLARIVDANGDGWKSFELDTSDLAGTKGDLVAEVSSPSSHDRLWCFEAVTE